MDDDGDVDGFDLADVTVDFVPTACNGACPHDLNDDGVVDSKDIKVLAEDYGRTDCPLNQAKAKIRKSPDSKSVNRSRL